LLVWRKQARTLTQRKLSLLLPRATRQEFLPLGTDDLLIDRLFDTIEARLCHAQLHLVYPILA
jgi:hypothetical protein